MFFLKIKNAFEITYKTFSRSACTNFFSLRKKKTTSNKAPGNLFFLSIICFLFLFISWKFLHHPVLRREQDIIEKKKVQVQTLVAIQFPSKLLH